MLSPTYFFFLLAALTVCVAGFPNCNNATNPNGVLGKLDVILSQTASFDYTIEQLPKMTPPYDPSDFLFYYVSLLQTLHRGALENRNASPFMNEETPTLRCYLSGTIEEVDGLIQDLLNQRDIVLEMYSNKDFNYADTISLMQYHTFAYLESAASLISDAEFRARFADWIEQLLKSFEQLRQAYSSAAK